MVWVALGLGSNVHAEAPAERQPDDKVVDEVGHERVRRFGAVKYVCFQHGVFLR